jgi:hypothetical protein
MRSLSVIARDIGAHWPEPYFGARPYLWAMRSLEKITDKYGADSADEIVMYFLSNAQTWRGEDARRIKAELKGMLSMCVTCGRPAGDPLQRQDEPHVCRDVNGKVVRGPKR